MNEQNDFFNEPTKDENDLARSNAPRQKKKKKKILIVLLAILIAVGSFFAGFFAYSLSLDKEIRTLIRVKNKIQKEYYQEVSDEAFYNAIFSSVENAKNSGYCTSEEAFYEAVFAGVNNGVLDEYSQYLTEEEFEALRVQSTGKQAGIGVYFLVGQTDLKVSRVAGNSPAEEAGMEKGDEIIAIGVDKTQLQACQNRKELNTYLATIDEGASFYLQWRTEKGEVKCEQMQRKDFIENYVFYKTNELSYGFEGEGSYKAKNVGEPLSYLPRDTAYIKLVQFNGKAHVVFDRAMNLFASQGKKNLVLDLRGNGGGYMNIMQSIAKYFCKNSREGTPVAAIADYGEKKQTFAAEGNRYWSYFSTDSRVTVLADNLTASASECLIGCMYAYGVLDYADICLVEEANGVAKTYGKGIMQTTYNILGGGGLRLTTAEIYWPTQTPISIHGVGVSKASGTQTVPSSLTFHEQTRVAIEKLGV